MKWFTFNGKKDSPTRISKSERGAHKSSGSRSTLGRGDGSSGHSGSRRRRRHSHSTSLPRDIGNRSYYAPPQGNFYPPNVVRPAAVNPYPDTFTMSLEPNRITRRTGWTRRDTQRNCTAISFSSSDPRRLWVWKTPTISSTLHRPTLWWGMEMSRDSFGIIVIVIDILRQCNMFHILHWITRATPGTGDSNIVHRSVWLQFEG